MLLAFYTGLLPSFYYFLYFIHLYTFFSFFFPRIILLATLLFGPLLSNHLYKYTYLYIALGQSCKPSTHLIPLKKKKILPSTISFIFQIVLCNIMYIIYIHICSLCSSLFWYVCVCVCVSVGYVFGKKTGLHMPIDFTRRIYTLKVTERWWWWWYKKISIIDL